MTLPAQTQVRLSVSSLTPGFEPIAFAAERVACTETAPTINALCQFPVTGVIPSVQDVFLFVASPNGSEGEFEVNLEVTPLGPFGGGSAGGSSGGGAGGGSAGAAGGGAAGSAGGAAGGSSGGSAQAQDLASRVWESQRDVLNLTSTARAYYLSHIQGWTAAARQAAGSSSNVMIGTLTETSTNVFTYSASPTDRLEIVRLGGEHYSLAVQSVSGTISSPNFPAMYETISFTWTEPGSVMRGTFWKDETTLVGTGYLSATAVEISTVNLSWSRDSHSWYDSQTQASFIDYTITQVGTVTSPSRALHFDAETMVIGCTGSGCWVAQTVTQSTVDVTTTVSGLDFALRYQRELTTPAYALPSTTFTGTVWSGGQVAGSMGRRLLAGTSYALEITIGTSRHLIETVSSAR